MMQATHPEKTRIGTFTDRAILQRRNLEYAVEIPREQLPHLTQILTLAHKEITKRLENHGIRFPDSKEFVISASFSFGEPNILIVMTGDTSRTDHSCRITPEVLGEAADKIEQHISLLTSLRPDYDHNTTIVLEKPLPIISSWREDHESFGISLEPKNYALMSRLIEAAEKEREKFPDSSRISLDILMDGSQNKMAIRATVSTLGMTDASIKASKNEVEGIAKTMAIAAATPVAEHAAAA